MIGRKAKGWIEEEGEYCGTKTERSWRVKLVLIKTTMSTGKG
jgi:hypothetical protein